MQNEKAVINLKFKSVLCDKDLKQVSAERKRILKKTEGLISLLCYTNDETKTIGGIFIFQNMRLANQYIGKFLTEGLGPRYGIIPKTLKIDVGYVKDEILGDNLEIKCFKA